MPIITVLRRGAFLRRRGRVFFSAVRGGAVTGDLAGPLLLTPVKTQVKPRGSRVDGFVSFSAARLLPSPNTPVQQTSRSRVAVSLAIRWCVNRQRNKPGHYCCTCERSYVFALEWLKLPAQKEGAATCKSGARRRSYM